MADNKIQPHKDNLNGFAHEIGSRRRNPILADIFSQLHYMERRGSGFKKICLDYSSQPNFKEELKPKFFSDDKDFVLTLYNLNYGSRLEIELKDENNQFPKVPQSSLKFPKTSKTARQSQCLCLNT